MLMNIITAQKYKVNERKSIRNGLLTCFLPGGRGNTDKNPRSGHFQTNIRRGIPSGGYKTEYFNFTDNMLYWSRIL